MTADIRVVSPYRPFPPESVEHQILGPFDWIGALRMLAVSVARSCACETLAITDVDTDLGVPALQFQTAERRLMLWILEISLCYLQSAAFDRDTVLVTPDVLVCGDLRPWFLADLGVLVRPTPKHLASGRPVLNTVQWWRVHAKKRLIRFYTEALAIARTLPDALIVWGADTEPIRQLIAPIAVGAQRRAGLRVCQINAEWVMESLSTANIDRLAQGVPPVVSRPILDFKYTRKRYLAPCFDALIAGAVPA